MSPPRRFDPDSPSFKVTDVMRLARGRMGIIAVGASDGCAKLGLFNEDVWEALEWLDPGDFYKTAVWENHPNKMVDIYYITVGEHNVYLKFSIVAEDYGSEKLIVSSFKENEQI